MDGGEVVQEGDRVHILHEADSSLISEIKWSPRALLGVFLKGPEHHQDNLKNSWQVELCCNTEKC